MTATPLDLTTWHPPELTRATAALTAPVDARGADWRDVTLSNVDLRDANLCRADLRGANLSTCQLEGVSRSNDRQMIDACFQHLRDQLNKTAVKS